MSKSRRKTLSHLEIENFLFDLNDNNKIQKENNLNNNLNEINKENKEKFNLKEKIRMIYKVNY